jgi:dinuclear metal center YbgI/SA1388 family protein
MIVSSFIEEFERELPLHAAMADDPVGLQVSAEDRQFETIAVAYEVNERIVGLTHDSGAGLLVVFHPLIYSPLRRLVPQGRVERCVIELIDRRIGLYVVHTAFDAHPDGTSALLGRGLELRGIRPLVPSAAIAGGGMGAVGDLDSSIPLSELARRLGRVCSSDCVRVSHAPNMPEPEIRRVAILGGSGMSFYDAAVEAGADAFVTADIRYHGFHAANDRIPVLDPGHAESEAFVVDGMTSLIEKTIARLGCDLRVVRLHEPTNPVRYFV